MIRQLCVAVALASVTAGAAAALAHAPDPRVLTHPGHRAWAPVMQRLADSDDRKESKRRHHRGVATGIRASNGLDDALPFDLHSSTRLDLLAAGTPQRWTF